MKDKNFPNDYSDLSLEELTNETYALGVNLQL